MRNSASEVQLGSRPDREQLQEQEWAQGRRRTPSSEVSRGPLTACRGGCCSLPRECREG